MRYLFALITTIFFVSPCAWAALNKEMLDSANYSKETKHLYDENGYVPLWYTEKGALPSQKVALDVLKSCDVDGLNPEDYKLPNETAWEKQEIALTEVFLKYIEHIRQGRIPPKKINANIKLEPNKTAAVEALRQAINAGGEYKKLRKMAPHVLDYRDLKEELKRYRKIAEDNKEWPTLKAKVLKHGDSGEEVERLSQILIALNDLDKDLKTDQFNDRLLEAVRRFQKRHTLEEDGIVGGKTREALNWPIQRQINKIIINMERLRWLPDEPGDRYLMVNVAGYEVRAVEDNIIEMRMPAIVGKPVTKTPLFYAKMEEVIVNPSWGVPNGILVRSKIPQIMRDPDYVHRAGFTVYDSSGSPVDPYDVDWANAGTSYRLRQSPGKHNALGQIKLNFKNPYTIYMHGTPEQNLFQKASRGFSSGCIRLEDPIAMAHWILGDEWEPEDLQKAIDKGGTQTIKSEPLPIYLTYLTAWVDDDGVAHFSDDIYNMDEQLIKMLKLEG